MSEYFTLMNEIALADPALPFGGYKKSGIGPNGGSPNTELKTLFVQL